MNKLVLTSIMTNMNITYKMPHVSTKLYSYIYSMYVQRGIRKLSGVRRRRKGELLDLSLLELFTGKKEKEKGSNFTQDEIISLAITNIKKVWNVKKRRKEKCFK